MPPLRLASRLNEQQAVALRARPARRKAPAAAIKPKPPTKDGYLCMDPRVLPPFFRPQKTPCQAPQIPYGDSAIGRAATRAAAAGFNAARVLDASNAGTFSEARRNALLGRGNEQDTLSAVTNLANAAYAGRVDADFAGRRIAELAAPPVAAAEAGTGAVALSAEQLAERKRLAAAGASNSAIEQARAAKLAEACDEHYCFIEQDSKGRPIAKNLTSGRTVQEIMASPAFLRWCTAEEAADVVAPPFWTGAWVINRLQRAAAAVHLAPAPQPVVVRQAPPPAAPPPPTPVVKKWYLCMDPRVLPPAFRPYPGPCIAPTIPYPE